MVISLALVGGLVNLWCAKFLGVVSSCEQTFVMVDWVVSFVLVYQLEWCIQIWITE